jgi:TP901 family phage tail tape measure protein
MNFVSSITLQFKDAFSSGFASAQNSFAGMKSALGEINQNRDMNRLAADLAMASSLTQPFRDGLANMMDMPGRLAGQFDSSMRNIQSLTNENNESLAQLGKELLNVGAVAGPNAVADAFYNIASGIGRAEVRMDTLKAAVALAESGQADLGAATSGLISVVNAYNTPAENMGALSDVFFQTVRKGVGSLDGFVGAMSSISGLSASVGIGFDELGSSMAFLTAKGQTESVAATQLKAAMVSLMRPNEDLSKALASMGISSGSAMLEQYGLAESLSMVKTALGGNQDKMAKALGSVEALQASIALVNEDYTSFAQSYATGLSGATTAALKAQSQSYEARVAKLQAASDALKIQMGGDINAIKGFFVDMGAGFLTHVAGPIMSSPVGGVFQGIAAATGLAAKTVLDLGSGALNTATQLVLLTSTVQNAGGFAKLFGSSLSLLTTPFVKIGGAALGAIPVIAAFGASLWTALLPILPIIAVVAAVVGGAFLLFKKWEVIPGWVKPVIAALFPFIYFPVLIIKNWDTIFAWLKGFFSSLAGSIKQALQPVITWLSGIWDSVAATFTEAWGHIRTFFTFVWDSMVSVVFSVANWFGNVWTAVSGAFAGVWLWIKDLFVSIWENIKGVVLGFIEWLNPVIDAIIAPFKAIGSAIGGIINTVGGWFGTAVDAGNQSAADMKLAKETGAKPVETNEPPALAANNALVPAPPVTATGGVPAPAYTSGIAAPVQFSAGTAMSSGNTALAEHLAAASRKGVAATDLGVPASDAFIQAGASVMPDFDSDFQRDFSTAARPVETPSLQPFWGEKEAKPAKSEPRVVKIENLYLQADDTFDLLNFVRELELAVLQPVEVAV